MNPASTVGVVVEDLEKVYVDPQTADEVHQLFSMLNRELGVTLVVATHNERLTQVMGRTLRLRDGRLFEER